MAESAVDEHSKLPFNLEEEPLNLSVLLDRGWKIFEDVDSTNEALNCDAVQNKVKLGLSMLEEASRMIAQLNLFSRNEELEEIATVDLKYMLLPALLGALTLKKINRDKRLEIIQTAQAYFNDFLKRCKEYNVSDFELPKSTDENRSPGAESGLSTLGVGCCLGIHYHRKSNIITFKRLFSASLRVYTFGFTLSSSTLAVLNIYYLIVNFLIQGVKDHLQMSF